MVCMRLSWGWRNEMKVGEQVMILEWWFHWLRGLCFCLWWYLLGSHCCRKLKWKAWVVECFDLTWLDLCAFRQFSDIARRIFLLHCSQFVAVLFAVRKLIPIIFRSRRHWSAQVVLGRPLVFLKVSIALSRAWRTGVSDGRRNTCPVHLRRLSRMTEDHGLAWDKRYRAVFEISLLGQLKPRDKRSSLRWNESICLDVLWYYEYISEL